MAIMQPDYNQNQDPSVAPTLGTYGGVVTGQPSGQGRSSVSGRGSGFTNLQSYIRANESNPNAQLIQKRTGQATTGQAEAQKGFETQRQTAQTGLEGIQSQAGLVQSALTNPIEFVKSQPNIERITALRTGQERIASPTELLANVQQSQAGLQSQRGQLAGGLQRDITGTGLQEYLRSQRINPELATAGESRLDRFLAEQTPSGQQAIQAGLTEAQRIQSLQTPDITDITNLANALQENPYITNEMIQQEITRKTSPEITYLTNLEPAKFVSPTTLDEINKYITMTREKYLESIDPNRIAYIKALSQISGQPFEQLGQALPESYQNILKGKETEIKAEQARVKAEADRVKAEEAKRLYDENYSLYLKTGNEQYLALLTPEDKAKARQEYLDYENKYKQSLINTPKKPSPIGYSNDITPEGVTVTSIPMNEQPSPTLAEPTLINRPTPNKPRETNLWDIFKI